MFESRRLQLRRIFPFTLIPSALLLPAVLLLPAALLLLAALLPATACKPPPVPVSSATRINPKLAGKNIAELTKLLNRKVRKGDLHLSITLWDLAFIKVYLEDRATKKNWDQPKLQQAMVDWKTHFLTGRTSFRVRLEALNRPFTVKGTDAVLNLNLWRWELWDSEGKHLQPFEIKVESKKVFKGTAGRYSFRVDGNLHFKYTIDPGRIRWIEVVAYPPGSHKAMKLPTWHVKR